ncbi:MAG: hypothetical protein ACJA2S_003570 [Cyclobacteriaceae bacterium]
MEKPSRWQSLQLDVFFDQAGNPITGSTPEFLSLELGNVKGFALSEKEFKKYEREGDSYTIYHDPGASSYLVTLSTINSSKLYQWNFSLVSIWSAQLALSDGVMWDISPKSIGNIDFDDLPKQLG